MNTAPYNLRPGMLVQEDKTFYIVSDVDFSTRSIEFLHIRRLRPIGGPFRFHGITYSVYSKSYFTREDVGLNRLA